MNLTSLRRRIRTLAVLSAVALVASGCGLIGGDGTYDVVAYFPRAVSLYETGQVQVLGLPAGEVTDIEVIGDQVKITMAIDNDVPVPEGVKAAIVPQSLIGERRVQLFPPFQEGDPVVSDGHVIAEDDTIVPVEPDEALEALKDFLDKLDPNGVGRLIDNAATSLDGQGQNLGNALDELSELVANVEANDDDIISIAERFDDFTATLLTRETQLAEAIDDFATVSSILASERQEIEELISALADLSGSGLDLVSEHAVRLRTDVEILTRLGSSIQSNLDTVDELLMGGRGIAAGIEDAYNADLNAVNLRTNLSMVVETVFSDLEDLLGIDIPTICFDAECPDNLLGPIVGNSGSDEAVPAEVPTATTPIDDIVSALGTPGAPEAGPDRPTETQDSRDRDDAGLMESFIGTFLGIGS